MRPLLVGEANPCGGDPAHALYPSPPGCAGDRLCRLVMGLSMGDYLARFDRTNLCRNRWSAREARDRAAELGRRRSPMVLLGARVATAFDLEFRPFTFSRRFAASSERLEIGPPLVVLPHPSGRSRLWNERGAFERARGILREAGVLPAASKG